MIAWKDTFRHAQNFVMSNERKKRDKLTYERDASYSGAQGSEYQQRALALREFYARDQRAKQRLQDQKTLEEFRNGRTDLVPRLPIPTQARREDLRLGPSSSGSPERYVNVDLSSVTRAGSSSHSSGEAISLSERNGSAPSTRVITVASLPVRRSVHSSTAGPSQSPGVIHDVLQISSTIDKLPKSLAAARLDSLLCGVRSWLENYIGTQSIGSIADSTILTLSTYSRLDFTNTCFPAAANVNPPDGSGLGHILVKRGDMGMMNPFEKAVSVNRLIGFSPNGFTFLGVGSPNLSGTYQISVSFSFTSTAAQNFLFCIEEDDAGVTLGTQPATRTAMMASAYVGATGQPTRVSFDFIWHNRGDSDGLRILAAPQGANATLSYSTPKIRVVRVELS